MKPFKHSVALALFVILSSLEARAFAPDGLQVFATTDAATAAGIPPGAGATAWTVQAAGAPLAIAPGTTVWIACLNTPDDQKRKYFRVELTAPAGGLGGFTLAGVGGYGGDDTSSPVSSEQTFYHQDGDDLTREYRLTPQPKWERIGYTNPAGGAAVVATAAVASVCAYRRPDVLITSALTLDAGSIGSATPGAMYGTPRFDSIWIFPETNTIDPAAAHPFAAPPASGAWARSVVHATPQGDPRPRGGVLWRTLGPGVPPDAEFSLTLSMLSAPADDRYEFYAFDAGNQSLMRAWLDWSHLEPIAYCTGKANSLGCTPSIGSQGMPSAGMQAGFLVRCTLARNNKPGVLLYTAQGRAANAFQGGLLCLQSPIRRTVGASSGGNPGPASDCSGVLALDMNAFAAGQLGGSPAPELRQPGRGIHCQWWSRDPQDPFGSSLSNALEYVVGN